MYRQLRFQSPPEFLVNNIISDIVDSPCFLVGTSNSFLVVDASIPITPYRNRFLASRVTVSLFFSPVLKMLLHVVHPGPISTDRFVGLPILVVAVF